MKTESASFQSGLLPPNTEFTAVELYEIGLIDGTTLYYTSYPYNVTVNKPGDPHDGRVYTTQKLQRSSYAQKRGVETSKSALYLLNDPDQIIVQGLSPAQSALAGRWIGASIVCLRSYNPAIGIGGAVTVSGLVTMLIGRAGAISQDRSKVTVEINSPLELLNMQVPWRTLGPECRWTLFDTLCGLDRTPFAVTGTVLDGSTPTQLLATLGQATGYFDGGVLMWTSGANTGLRGTVRSFIGEGAANAYPNIILADNPLLYLRLNSDTVDSSGHAYTNTNNGVTFSPTGGPLAAGSGYAIFDGASTWIDLKSGANQIPNPRSLTNFLAAMSFEFWFKVSNPVRQPSGLFGTGARDQHAGLWNFSDPKQNNPGFQWGVKHPLAEFVAALDEWVHCIAVFRGQRYIDIFTNGYLNTTVEDAGADGFDWQAPTIGKAVLPASAGGLVQWFGGQTAEHAWYPYPLDAGQAAAHYEAGVIDAATLTASEINLILPAQNPPQAGDTFTVYPGCSKSLHACIYKFNNKLRFGGAPYIPPSNQTG